ncbi:unnamed protein product [Rotaria sp. Silwood2]|nr:unnamed protein product [Rotaria sp. Silwood2]
MGAKSNKIFDNDNVSQMKNAEENMNQKDRIKFITLLILRLIGLLALLYLFVCSLDLMSSAFRLIGG